MRHCEERKPVKTYTMNTTSHCPSLSPSSSNRSKSITFCSTFPLACAGKSSAGVTRRPTSQTRVNVGHSMSSRRRWRPVWPVAPKMSAVFAALNQTSLTAISLTRKIRPTRHGPLALMSGTWVNQNAFLLLRRWTIAQNKGVKAVWTHKMSRIIVCYVANKYELVIGDDNRSCCSVQRSNLGSRVDRMVSLSAQGRY